MNGRMESRFLTWADNFAETWVSIEPSIEVVKEEELETEESTNVTIILLSKTRTRNT
jgi:hypothetical protein